MTLHRLASELAGAHLTSSEISALANLVETHTGTVSDLAAAMGIRPTTLTSVLDRLEQRGYLQRRPHPHDRRSTLLELTAPGRDCAHTIREAMDKLEQRALEHVSPAALDHFQQVLGALTEAAS